LVLCGVGGGKADEHQQRRFQQSGMWRRPRELVLL
jgi:hypothetical protein